MGRKVVNPMMRVKTNVCIQDIKLGSKTSILSTMVSSIPLSIFHTVGLLC